MSTSTSGTSHADLADRAGDDGAHALHHGAGQLPPDGGRGDDGQPDDEQPDAVAPLLGVEVAGAAPDRPGDRADRVGDAEPHRGHAAAERGEGPEDRPRPAADGARRRPARARGRALARGPLLAAGPCGRTPGSGARASASGPPRRLDRPDLDVLLLREPGGEDVRVAMTPNVCHRHSSHTDHTAVSALDRTADPAQERVAGKFSRGLLDPAGGRP